MLNGSHDETIRHEACEALKVEWWRPALRGRRQVVLCRPRHFAIQLLELDREKRLIAGGGGIQFLLTLAQADGSQRLGDGVGDPSQDLM